MTKKKFLSFIDLFAGCGGLSLGLEQAGFTPIYVNELNKDALATYLYNRKENKNIHDPKFSSQDILGLTDTSGNLQKLQTEIKKTYGLNKGDLDLIVGGPPCQGFSGIGHRRNYGVERRRLPYNFLYKKMIKVIDFFQPKIFLFENVKGLISAKWTKNGKKGEVLKDVQKSFLQLDNYFRDTAILHSKDYGVPQNRPRIFIIGIRKDLNFIPMLNKVASGLLPEKDINQYPDAEDLLNDLLDKNYSKTLKTEKYLINPKNNIQKKLRTKKNKTTFFKKGDWLQEQDYSKHSDKIVQKFIFMIKNNSLIPKGMQTKKFSQKVIPGKWNRKRGPNITATSLPDDYVHYKQPRILTVREWARLQMFPDWYVFKGKRTTGGKRRAGNPKDNIWDRDVPKYTQIGNAVPVELSRRIGENFKSLLKKLA